MTSNVTRWRRAATMVVAAMLAGLVSVLVQGTAHACSCVQASPQEQIDWSDAVFVGTPVDKADPGGGGEVTWTFQVDTVHRGSATATTAVTSAADSAACGITMSLHEQYLVFATEENGQKSTGLCSGTGPLDRADPELIGLLGAGAPPAADPQPLAPPTPEPQASESQSSDPQPSPVSGRPAAAEPAADGATTWWVVGVAALVLVLAAGVLLLVRTRRRT